MRATSPCPSGRLKCQLRKQRRLLGPTLTSAPWLGVMDHFDVLRCDLNYACVPSPPCDSEVDRCVFQLWGRSPVSTVSGCGGTSNGLSTCVECDYKFDEVFDRLEYPDRPHGSVTERYSYYGSELVSDIDSGEDFSELYNCSTFDDCHSATTNRFGCFAERDPEEQGLPWMVDAEEMTFVQDSDEYPRTTPRTECGENKGWCL
ncbi:hypothetical protein J6590_062603 [Homalodisca vitripennis]|nr:hypothetical protein J6590_093558 [Homalodisca vitripennis]KAG8320713.1 hypothetical protein J6590_062603 [Homalodisca vitripennis]